ncbi:MAG: hypothetical protein GEV07_21645 [Streptosporangiales bacterium]|nr:hypothetical protein [Streptosporangiales bacterium]
MGAGGASVAYVEGGALRVGPHSAGSEPGPAAYGQGGEEPTVTDAHVALGRLSPTQPGRATRPACRPRGEGDCRPVG